VVDYNTNNKLNFVLLDKHIKIALSPMDRWSTVPKDSCDGEKYDENNFSGYRHIRIAVSYVTKPKVKNFNTHKNGYSTSFISKFLPHPEFHLYPVKGLKLDQKSVKVRVFVKKEDLEVFELQFNIKDKSLDIIQEIEENKYILSLNSEVFGDLVYNFDFLAFIISYEVKNQEMFLLMPFFALFSFILSLLELVSRNILGFPSIALLSTIALYLGLIKDNYEIPYNRFVILMFTMSFVCIFYKLKIIN